MREGASRLVRAFFYVPEKPHFQRIDGSFCPQRERQRGSDRRVSIFANGGMLAPNRKGDEILSQQSASFRAD
jgi:hypothetical protein